MYLLATKIIFKILKSVNFCADLAKLASALKLKMSQVLKNAFEAQFVLKRQRKLVHLGTILILRSQKDWVDGA